jgi:hypothetical protein
MSHLLCSECYIIILVSSHLLHVHVILINVLVFSCFLMVIKETCYISFPYTLGMAMIN